MKMTIGTVGNVEPEMLKKLFDIIDEIGMCHDYSLTNGELEIYVGDIGIRFEADRKLMDEAAQEAYWQEDAERIAEGYWRE
jgi:hypothetical protein